MEARCVGVKQTFSLQKVPTVLSVFTTGIFRNPVNQNNGYPVNSYFDFTGIPAVSGERCHLFQNLFYRQKVNQTAAGRLKSQAESDMASTAIDTNRQPLPGVELVNLWPLRHIQLEAVNFCNYRCPLCRTHLKDGIKRRKIRLDQVQKIVRPIAAEVSEFTLYGTRGEAFLHERLEEIVSYLKSTTSARVCISTNGSLVTEQRALRLLGAGPDQIIFAIDGITPETYGIYRIGGPFGRVIENLKKLCELKAKVGFRTRVVFQFIPMAGNEHEISGLADFGYALGVDVVKLKFSTSVAGNDTFRTDSLTYRPATPGSKPFECPSGLEKLYVDPNGDAYPCCYA
ncbi:radical SAM/SPASM domain-containing protein [Thermodesulfobacteriota bacterium]